MADIEYNFEDFNQGLESIFNNIKSLPTRFDRVVAISRGGLFLGARLSYKLDIPLTPIVWSFRQHAERESVPWLAEDINEGQRILLCDGMIDSGKTIETLLDDWEASTGTLDRECISIATCWLNVAQDVMPDFWHKTINRDEDQRYVNFWWEK